MAFTGFFEFTPHLLLTSPVQKHHGIFLELYWKMSALVCQRDVILLNAISVCINMVYMTSVTGHISILSECIFVYVMILIMCSQMYPETREGDQPCLPPGSFLTCSSDNTVRLWNTDAHNASLSRNLISNVSEGRPECPYSLLLPPSVGLISCKLKKVAMVCRSGPEGQHFEFTAGFY